MTKLLTAIIQREGDGHVALCLEVDVASQGDTMESARENLREALELFFECASAKEVQQRGGRNLRDTTRSVRWVNCVCFLGEKCVPFGSAHDFWQVRIYRKNV
jgi:predicted RNase H-like HicB family nuclease